MHDVVERQLLEVGDRAPLASRHPQVVLGVAAPGEPGDRLAAAVVRGSVSVTP
jgi:hypothetical protein